MHIKLFNFLKENDLRVNLRSKRMKPRLYVIHSLEVTHMYINNWLTIFKLNWSIESHLIDQTNCLMSACDLSGICQFKCSFALWKLACLFEVSALCWLKAFIFLRKVHFVEIFTEIVNAALQKQLVEKFKQILDWAKILFFQPNI